MVVDARGAVTLVAARAGVVQRAVDARLDRVPGGTAVVGHPDRSQLVAARDPAPIVDEVCAASAVGEGTPVDRCAGQPRELATREGDDVAVARPPETDVNA